MTPVFSRLLMDIMITEVNTEDRVPHNEENFSATLSLPSPSGSINECIIVLRLPVGSFESEIHH